MYILKIIPIAKGLPENYFSYFSKEKLSLGSLVEIKIRNRKVFGIVAESNSLEKEKINIKSERFSLKKIERIISQNFISSKLFQSLKESSILLGAKESDLIENYIPNFLFENLKILEELKSENQNTEKKKMKSLALIENFKERHAFYTNLIKENFKEKKSTVIFFPTINDLEQSLNYFQEKKIENLSIFHSAETKKEIKENLLKLEKEKPVLILSSVSIFPFLIKNKINLKSIILEKENSYNYFTHTAKKQIDGREILKKITQDLNLELILGGAIISLKAFQESQNTLNKNNSSLREISKNKVNEIVDLSKDTVELSLNSREEKYSKVYFSIKLIKELEKINKNGGKVFLFAKRKGLYTETVCSDCNTIFKCQNCDKPYTLFKKENEHRFYICASCKEKIELKKTENLICQNCGGWRLKTLGVGVEGIEENLKTLGFKTFILDSQNAKTKKDIKNILDSWQKENKSILIGTDLALNFLNTNHKTDLASIISIDSLFSIPEINIDEKIFNLILEIEEKTKTKKNIIIQTRLPKQNIWQYIENKNITEFLKDELKIRVNFNLPPYSNILKFKLTKKDIKNKNHLEKILERIFLEENINPEKISWRIDKTTGNYIGTLNISKENWEIKKEGIILPSNFAKKVVNLLSDFFLEINPPKVL